MLINARAYNRVIRCARRSLHIPPTIPRLTWLDNFGTAQNSFFCNESSCGKHVVEAEKCGLVAKLWLHALLLLSLSLSGWHLLHMSIENEREVEGGIHLHTFVGCLKNEPFANKIIWSLRDIYELPAFSLFFSVHFSFFRKSFVNRKKMQPNKEKSVKCVRWSKASPLFFPIWSRAHIRKFCVPTDHYFRLIGLYSDQIRVLLPLIVLARIYHVTHLGHGKARCFLHDPKYAFKTSSAL